MKRLFSVILMLLLLTTGCAGSKTTITPVTKGISFLCDVEFYNESYSCEGDIQKNGDTTIKFISPSQLEGLKYTFTKNGVSVVYNEIEYISDKVVFESSVASLINDVLHKENSKVLCDNDVFYTEGVTSDFDYKLEFGATGLPLKITTRPDAASVVFKDVKIK